MSQQRGPCPHYSIKQRHPATAGCCLQHLSSLRTDCHYDPVVCCVSQCLSLWSSPTLFWSWKKKKKRRGRSSLACLPQYTCKLHFHPSWSQQQRDSPGAHTEAGPYGPSWPSRNHTQACQPVLAELSEKRWQCWAQPEDILGPSFPVKRGW